MCVPIFPMGKEMFKFFIFIFSFLNISILVLVQYKAISLVLVNCLLYGVRTK